MGKHSLHGLYDKLHTKIDMVRQAHHDTNEVIVSLSLSKSILHRIMCIRHIPYAVQLRPKNFRLFHTISKSLYNE